MLIGISYHQRIFIAGESSGGNAGFGENISFVFSAAIVLCKQKAAVNVHFVQVKFVRCKIRICQIMVGNNQDRQLVLFRQIKSLHRQPETIIHR